MEITLAIKENEQDFIKACIKEEEWAQKKLYEQFYSSMYPVTLRYAVDEEEALDILHEGFIKVFRHISKYTVGTSLNAWIRRIMVNTSIDYYRKKSRRRTENIDDARSISNTDPDVVSQMSAQEIISALQQLSPAYRAVFNLYVIEGYSHKEVAAQLDITESTSRSNLVKARTKLRTILVAEGIVNER